MQWFRGGLVYKAHRLVYHSTPGLRVIDKKKKKDAGTSLIRNSPPPRTITGSSA